MQNRSITMPSQFRRYLSPLLGVLLLVSFVQGNGQETVESKQTTVQESLSRDHPLRLGTSQYRQLLEKAKTDSKDFSDDEVRVLLYEVCLNNDGLDEYYPVALSKLHDLGSAIFPLLLEEASQPLETMFDWYITEGTINFFDKFNISEEERAKARKTTLTVFEKAPTLYRTFGRVIGNIGEPEDVPKLLSFINEDSHVYTFYNIIRAVSKIAAVSQIPEVEKAITMWNKNKPSGGEWRKEYQAEVKQCLSNIRERNVQWTPNTEKEKGSDDPIAPDASVPTRNSNVFVPIVVTLSVLALLVGGVFSVFRRCWCGCPRSLGGAEIVEFEDENGKD